MATYSVLIADDDASIRQILERICQDLHWAVECAQNGDEALQIIDKNSFDIYILDVKMPGPSGMELAKIILEKNPTAAILIMTGYTDVKQAVQAIKKGVFEYISKDNIQIDTLKEILFRAIAFHENRIVQIEAQQERDSVFQNIEQANRQFQSILDLSADLIFILNARTGEIVDCNRSAHRSLGYTREELLSFSYYSLIDGYDQEKWLQVVSSIRSKSKGVVERNYKHKSNDRVPVSLSYAYVCLKSGEYIAVIARDITHQKEIERELEESELKFRTLFESSSDAIMLLNEKGFYDCNQATLHLFGLTRKEEFVRLHPSELSPPYQSNGEDSFSAAEAKIKEAFTNGFAFFEWIHRKESGEDFPAEVLLTVFNQQGVPSIQATVRNITERKQAEAKLREQQKQVESQAATLETIIENMEEGIVLADSNGIITKTNNWFEDFVQTPKEFVQDQPIDKIIQLVTGCEIKNVLNDYKSGQIADKACLYSDVNDQRFMITIHPIYQQDCFQGVVLNLVDISNLVSAQKQAEEDIKYNRNFLQNAAKDLRLPIDGIETLTQQLSETTLDESQKLLLETIQEFTKSLHQLIRANDE